MVLWEPMVLCDICEGFSSCTTVATTISMLKRSP